MRLSSMWPGPLSAQPVDPATDSRTRRNDSPAPGGRLLRFDVLVDPSENQVRQLQTVPVLHQHVAVALDAKRRQVHQLGVAAGFRHLIDERFAALERPWP